MASPIGVNVTDSSQVGNTKGIATILLVVAVIFIVLFAGSKVMKLINGTLEGLGLKDDPTEAKNKETVQTGLEKETNKGVMSAWSPQYYKNAPGGSALLTVATAKALAKTMWDSVGYITDTPSLGEGVIKQLKTKTQVSFLADTFYKTYKVDLLSWLQNKYDTNEQKQFLASMLAYVKALPDYNNSH